MLTLERLNEIESAWQGYKRVRAKGYQIGETLSIEDYRAVQTLYDLLRNNAASLLSAARKWIEGEGAGEFVCSRCGCNYSHVIGGTGLGDVLCEGCHRVCLHTSGMIETYGRAQVVDPHANCIRILAAEDDDSNCPKCGHEHGETLTLLVSPASPDPDGLGRERIPARNRGHGAEQHRDRNQLRRKQ